MHLMETPRKPHSQFTHLNQMRRTQKAPRRGISLAVRSPRVRIDLNERRRSDMNETQSHIRSVAIIAEAGAFTNEAGVKVLEMIETEMGKIREGIEVEKETMKTIVIQTDVKGRSERKTGMIETVIHMNVIVIVVPQIAEMNEGKGKEESVTKTETEIEKRTVVVTENEIGRRTDRSPERGLVNDLVRGEVAGRSVMTTRTSTVIETVTAKAARDTDEQLQRLIISLLEIRSFN